VAAASVAVVLGLLLLGGKVGDMHPWYLLLFVLGMAGAVATSSTDPAFAARRDRVPWVRIAQGLMGLFVCEWVGVALFCPAVFAHRRLPWQQYSFIETVSGLVLLCGFMHWHRVQRVLPVARWPLVLRMLHQRQIMGLGRFSYSLYLVHLPVLATVIGLVRSLGLGEAPTLLLAYCTALPLAIAAGYLFFLAVERRCLPTYAKQPEPVAARVLASEQSA
jgi:peptidoglycan/LPS O-acetylase OafA/YrhL